MAKEIWSHSEQEAVCVCVGGGGAKAGDAAFGEGQALHQTDDCCAVWDGAIVILHIMKGLWNEGDQVQLCSRPERSVGLSGASACTESCRCSLACSQAARRTPPHGT